MSQSSTEEFAFGNFRFKKDNINKENVQEIERILTHLSNDVKYTFTRNVSNVDVSYHVDCKEVNKIKIEVALRDLLRKFKDDILFFNLYVQENHILGNFDTQSYQRNNIITEYRYDPQDEFDDITVMIKEESVLKRKL